MPCCCERSVDLKLFDKENNCKSFDLLSPLTKESIQRTLSSKLIAQLKLNENSSRGQLRSLPYHSSPRSNICALDKCKNHVEDAESKQVVIYSKVKMNFCSYSCWNNWLQQLNKPYMSNKKTHMSKLHGKNKEKVLSNINVNNLRSVKQKICK